MKRTPPLPLFFSFSFFLEKDWDVDGKGEVRIVTVLRCLVLWCCIQKGQQKSTMAGRVMEVMQNIVVTVLQMKNWRKKKFRLDCDHKEHDFLTVLSPPILLLATILIWAVSKPRGGQLCRRKAWLAKLGACHPNLESLLSRLGLALLFPQCCQVMTTTNFSTLKHGPWDFIRRWLSINQALKQRDDWLCMALSLRWEMGILEWWHRN